MKKSKSAKPKSVTKRVFRSATTGKFVLGSTRFAKISEVEGIVIRKAASVLSTEERRQAVTRKYRKG